MQKKVENDFEESNRSSSPLMKFSTPDKNISESQNNIENSEYQDSAYKDNFDHMKNSSECFDPSSQMMSVNKNDSQLMISNFQEDSSVMYNDHRSEVRSKHSQKYCGKKHKIENRRAKYSPK